MTKGKAGQTSTVSFAGVSEVQTSRKLRPSGVVVIQKQRFAIAGTHAPVPAMTPSLCFPWGYIYPHRNQKFLAGLRRGAFRLVSPSLHRVESVSGR